MPTRAQPDPMQDDSDSGLGGEDVQLFPELKIRGSPKHLASPIKHFNACQKNVVRALGLGDILDFQVEGIPKSMCRWLISNFDPTNMCLSLENGLVVPVTEEDIHYTLGLPRGSVVITKRRKDDVSDTLKEWRSKVQLLYVDRVVHFDRVVPRLVPSLRGWSSRHLKARQLSEIRSGGFGRGIVEGHLVVATDHEVCSTLHFCYALRKEWFAGMRVCIIASHSYCFSMEIRPFMFSF
nr:uncharacterized protein LOC109174777 [Ipomoea batatas]GME03276.1 uncharacterized protein LOC109174777 [Ipomoea batatas]